MANAITQLMVTTPSLVSANAKSIASLACNGSSSDKPNSLQLQRRIVVCGLAGAVLGLNVGDENAWAAKRQTATPAAEKKDPNVSGVMAKIMASKKRKEAMKEAMAKQREKGKSVDE